MNFIVDILGNLAKELQAFYVDRQNVILHRADKDNVEYNLGLFHAFGKSLEAIHLYIDYLKKNDEATSVPNQITSDEKKESN